MLLAQYSAILVHIWFDKDPSFKVSDENITDVIWTQSKEI